MLLVPPGSRVGGAPGWVGPQGTGGASLSRGRRRSLSSHGLGAGQLWSPGSRHQEGVSRVGLTGGRGGERGGVGRGADIWGGGGGGEGKSLNTVQWRWRGGWCRPRAHTAHGETSPSGLSLKPPMRHGGPEAWELQPVGWTHTSKQASLPGQPSLSTWPSPWCGCEGRPVQAKQVRPGRAAPLPGAPPGPWSYPGRCWRPRRWLPGPGCAREAGRGHWDKSPALRLTRCPRRGREGAAGRGRGGAGGQEAGTVAGGAGEEGGGGVGSGIQEVGVPSGAAELGSTSQRSWSGLTCLRRPLAWLFPVGPPCSSPKLGLSRAQGLCSSCTQCLDMSPGSGPLLLRVWP